MRGQNEWYEPIPIAIDIRRKPNRLTFKIKAAGASTARVSVVSF